jgi:single-strand DNA-binding protein
VFQNFTKDNAYNTKALSCRFQTTKNRKQTTNYRKIIVHLRNFAVSNSMLGLMSDKNNFSNFLKQKKMNALKNKVSLIGRLGVQPEVVNLDSGKKLARFTLATNENYKNKNGEWQSITQWHTINAWGKLAELVQKLLTKGQEIVVEGKLVNQSYENKNGEKRYTTIVEASEFLVLTTKEK